MTGSRGGAAESGGPLEALYDEARRAAPPSSTVMSQPTPAVACVLWRRSPTGDGIEVFAVQRAFSHRFLGGMWGFSGGGVEASDRDSIAACAREVREELAVDLPDDAARFVAIGRHVTPSFSPIRFDAEYFFVEAPSGAAPDPSASREHRDGRWVTPQAALDAFARGEWLVAPPVVGMLAALAPGLDGAPARLAASALAERSRRLWWLAAGAAVCPLRTPTLPPATHTNAYVFTGGGERVDGDAGGGDLVVIDPATPHDDERAELDRELAPLLAAGARVVALLLTHHHARSRGGAAHLAARTGVPIAAHADTARLLAGRVEVDRLLADGDVSSSPAAPAPPARHPHARPRAGAPLLRRRGHGVRRRGDMVACVEHHPGRSESEGDMTLVPGVAPPAGALWRAGAPAGARRPDRRRGRASSPSTCATGCGARSGSRRAGRARPRHGARAGADRVRRHAARPVRPLAERSLVAHLVKLAADGGRDATARVAGA